LILESFDCNGYEEVLDYALSLMVMLEIAMIMHVLAMLALILDDDT